MAFVLIPMLAALAHCAPESPRAHGGQLTLSEWNLQSGPPVPLSGEWQVYWNQLVPPEAFEHGTPPAPDGVFILPGLWRDVKFGATTAGKYGHATFVLNVTLPEDHPLGLAFRTRDMAQAYALFADGVPVMRAGRVGTNRAEEMPRWEPQIGTHVAPARTTRLVLQVSNYHHRLGGAWFPVEMGSLGRIQDRRETALALDMAMLAAALILAVYHLFVFASRPEERSPLLFAIFCFCFALRVSVTGEMFALHLLPGIPWEVALKIEYLSYFLAVPAFAWFIQTVFPQEFSNRVRIGLVLAGGAFSLLVLVTPARFFSETLLAYHAITLLASIYAATVLIRCVLHRRAGARGFLASFIVLFAAALNDILFSQMFFSTSYLAPAGSVVFVGFQALLLSRRLTRALRDLQDLSGALEDQVHARTAELAAAVVRAGKSEQEARVRQGEAESSRTELEKLTEIARTITATTDLHNIMSLVARYLETHFAIEGTMLQLVKADGSALGHFATNFKAFHTPELQGYIREFTIPLSPAVGTAASIIRRRKPAYFPRFAVRVMADSDPLLDLVRTASINSALIVPLFVRDRLVGLLYFSSYSRRLELRRTDIATISRFCDQIAGAVQASTLLERAEDERRKSDRLLLNILPEPVATELKERGAVRPVLYHFATILFTDFKGFTSSAATMAPRALVEELDRVFEQFDAIMDKYGMEKLKTIGDAYMAAGGLPLVNQTHPVDACLAALEMQALIEQIRQVRRDAGAPDFWELRIGIHTGPVIAGVIGKNKFAYDIWGDTVNVASRMETASEPGRVNVSPATYELVREFFECESRGNIGMKNRGTMDMYFLGRIHSGLAQDEQGRVPGPAFQARYQEMSQRQARG